MPFALRQLFMMFTTFPICGQKQCLLTFVPEDLLIIDILRSHTTSEMSHM